MKTIHKTVLAVSTVLTVSGFTIDKAAANYTTYDVGQILSDKKASAIEKAERLAHIGESLSTPSGFMYADEVLNLALKYDPNNARAGLYKMVLAPLMETRGLVQRVTPLSQKFSLSAQRELNIFRQKIAVNPAVNHFFTYGKSDIATEAQAQRVIDRIRTAQNNLRIYFKSNRNLNLTLQPMTPYDSDVLPVWKSCPVLAVQRQDGYSNQYKTKNCDFMFRRRLKIDSGDIEALQQIAAGMQIAASIAGAYDATGAAKLEKFLVSKPGATEKEGVSVAKQQSALGNLRRAAGMTVVKTLGTDFYSGARWLQRYQDRFCPKGGRRGHLFSGGLCTTDSTDSLLRVMQVALAGSTVGVMVRDGKFEITDLAKNKVGDLHTRANLFAPFVNPVADLKTTLPTQFSPCGNSMNLGDPTVGGFLPHADGVKVGQAMGVLGKPCK